MLAGRGCIPHANDWQWLIGFPVLSLGIWLINWKYGEGTISLSQDTAAGIFMSALAAFILTLIATFICKLVYTPAVLFHSEKQRADALTERLRPKMRVHFSLADAGCVHKIPEPLTNGKAGIIIRVLPVCLIDASIVNCRGHLNGVYRRVAETDKWSSTILIDRLFLKWSTIDATHISIHPGTRQYLDIGAIDEDGDFVLFVHDFQWRGTSLFRTGGLFRLDVVITGLRDEEVLAQCSIQLKQTEQWDRPELRVLGPDELAFDLGSNPGPKTTDNDMMAKGQTIRFETPPRLMMAGYPSFSCFLCCSHLNLP